MHVPKQESCIHSTEPKLGTGKKWRKKLLCRKNMQATARSESAVFLTDPLWFTRKNFETKEVKNLHHKNFEMK